jgi:hypothetical protein
MSTAPVGVRTITGSPTTITFPLLLAGSVGALLIYAAIKNETPVQVIRDAIGQQKPAPQKQGVYQYGPYNPNGTGLQPKTAPRYQMGPYDPSGSGLQPNTPVNPYAPHN